MDAAAHDVRGLFAVGRVFDEVGELDSHGGSNLSQVRIEAAGIENSRRVELRLQALVNRGQRGCQWSKDSNGAIAASEQGCVTAGFPGAFSHLLRALIRSQPAQGAVPFDQLRAANR